MSNAERILTVNEQDEVLNSENKLLVHQQRILHRAFSIFIFNSEGKMLIQKRALKKYHSSGLWSNACCSHQREKEDLKEAIHRRLKEEMGFDCNLKEIFIFRYDTEIEKDLYENEIDHIFLGKFDGKLSPNKEEVSDFKWINVKELKEDILKNPGEYTYWFKELLKNRLLRI
jgi:isopentenyl-diphosphate delta-isomerase